MKVNPGKPLLNVSDKSLLKVSIKVSLLNDIGKIIKGLDPNKAHGQDMMSIGMLKI